MTPDEQVKMLDNASAALSEHFDTVQIFVTKHDHSGTSSCHGGKGNWYARYGCVREWMIKNEERDREVIRHENDDE